MDQSPSSPTSIQNLQIPQGGLYERLVRLEKQHHDLLSLLDVQEAQIECLHDMIDGFGEFFTENIRMLEERLEETP
jgi:hypothetical protein